MHITYGLILQARDDNGNYVFRDEFFQVLHACEQEYAEALKKHIGRHLKLLGL